MAASKAGTHTPSVPTGMLSRFSNEHLHYEIGMFFNVAWTFENGISDPFIVNVFLESFAAHSRILHDFFYGEQKAHKTDSLAIHFFDDPNDWIKIRPDPRYLAKFEILNRTAWEIVHLSYNRLNVKPEEKEWAISKISQTMWETIKSFGDHANKEKLGSSIFQLLKEIQHELDRRRTNK